MSETIVIQPRYDLLQELPRLWEIWWNTSVNWGELAAGVLTPSMAIQFIAIGMALLGTVLVVMLLSFLLHRAIRDDWWGWRFRLLIRRVLTPLVYVVISQALAQVLEAGTVPTTLVDVVSNLALVWMVIQVLTSFIEDRFWARAVAAAAIVLVTLDFLNLRVVLANFLDSLALPIGNLNLSVYLVLKVVAITGGLIWAALLLSQVVESRLQRSRRLTPALQVLYGNLARIGLLVAAALMVLSALSIDLTAFTVFSGAFGLALGFGLQRVASNLVSGFVMLMDQSVKPGDVIEIQGTYGWLTKLGSRYAAVLTRDGTEHLIPNEEFISTRVINWSHTSRKVRRKVPFHVSYDSDPELVIKLAKEAAAETPRVLSNPKPNCLLMRFGERGFEMEARFWIDDPSEGVNNVASDMQLRLLKKLREARMKVPLPTYNIRFGGDDVEDEKMDALKQLAKNTTR